MPEDTFGNALSLSLSITSDSEELLDFCLLVFIEEGLDWLKHDEWIVSLNVLLEGCWCCW